HTRFSRDWSSDVCSSDLAFPPLLEARLGVGAPVARPRQAARRGAVAICGAVILVFEVLAVVRRLVVLLAEVAVCLLVGAIGAVGAVPGIADGRLRGLPVQGRLAAGLVPTGFQVGLGLLPVAAAGFVAVLGAEAVGRGVVAIEVAVGAVVLAAGRILAPVFDFGGGVDAFSDRLAAGGATHRADAATDERADRAEEAADCGARNRACGAAGGDADGVGPRCAGNRIAVLVVLVHGVAPVGRGMSGDHAFGRVRGPCTSRGDGLNEPVRTG